MLAISEDDIVVVGQKDIPFATRGSKGYELLLAKLIRETSSSKTALRIPRLTYSQTNYLRTTLKRYGYRFHYRTADPHTFLWVEKLA